MPLHVLVERIFGQIHFTKSAAEHLGIVLELITAHMALVVFKGREPQVTVLAVPDVFRSEIFRWPSALSVAGVLEDPGAGCEALSTSLTDKLINFHVKLEVLSKRPAGLEDSPTKVAFEAARLPRVSFPWLLNRLGTDD